MHDKRRRGRDVVLLGVAIACIVAWCPSAFALNPSLDVSQYAHTAWRIREGLSKGIINAIAQTPDGYLWLGTEFGLLRFDGVKSVAWQPPPDEPLPSSWISSLLTARDGTLWIGTSKGLASWRDGKLTRYQQLDGQYVIRLLEDRAGSVWAGTIGVPAGRLCAIQKGSVRCHGEDGGLGLGVVGLYEDSKGWLWVGVSNGLWRWKPDPAEFHSIPGELDSLQSFDEAENGALLMSTNHGIRRLLDGKTDQYRLPGISQAFRTRSLLRDREGSLWIGTADGGLLHIHEGRTDRFTRADGLSGNDIHTLFQDREGSIWVGTNDGVDRFRDVAVPTFGAGHGLSGRLFAPVLATSEGNVWLGTDGGLNRWKNGWNVGPRIGQQHGRFSGETPGSLFQDDRGRLWVSTIDGVGYIEDDRFISLSGVPGGPVRDMAQDTHGNVWIASQNHGLFRLSRGAAIQQFSWAALGHEDFASALVADRSQGGLWLGFFNGGLVYFNEGRVQASYTSTDGLGPGRVNHLHFQQEGTLWAATAGGLTFLKNGHIVTLTSRNGLPCDVVHWAMKDDAHSIWLNLPCGLIRIRDSDLAAWVANVDKGGDPPAVQTAILDSSDGVQPRAEAGGNSPQVTKSTDGRLWFAGADGVSVVDPRHLPFNRLPPPVHIEQLIADRKTYDVASDAVHLPALTRDLQIDYTALSLVAPEKMRFRYMLEGKDREWQDVGTRRQAFYNDLAPRSYRFRVIASNNSGVWNEAGAALNFSVEPAYYQTDAFRMLSAVAVVIVFGAILHLRSRQVARQFNMRLEERVNERTRIARDLHDTLLQSFHGVLLRFQAVTYLLPDRPAEAQAALNAVIEQASQAVTEGRDAVEGLRPSAVVSSDFAGAIGVLGDELAKQITTSAPDFRVDVEGIPRDLAPLLGDEVYRIAGEALRNAFRHANARHIEVEVHYDRRAFRLRVRDDGKGIDPKVLAGGGATGHYGLAGMHERAAIVGGTLTIWSQLDSGTETELIIPASIAYAKSSATQRSMPSGTET